MDLSTYFQFVAALAFVLALIGCAALVARRFGLGHAVRTAGSRRLGVVEILPLDGRRKLVLLQCDDTEHLVIIGQTGETVVDRRPAPANSSATLATDISAPETQSSTFAGRLRQVVSREAWRRYGGNGTDVRQARAADPLLSENVT